MKKLDKGTFYIILSGLCYGIMVIFVRFLAKSIPPYSQVFLRYLVAAAVAFAFAKITHTNLKFKKPRDYLVMLFMGIFGYGLTNAFYTLGIINTTIASAEFIFSTYVVIVPITALFILKEKLSPKIILSALLSLFGTHLLFNPAGLTSMTGGIYAGLAALLNALYIIGSRFLRNYPAKTLLVYSTLCGVFSIGLITFAFESNFYFSAVYSLPIINWIIIILFGLDNFIAWLLLNKGLQTVKAGIASIILLITPVIAALIAAIIYSEIPTTDGLTGIILIIISVILISGEK